MDAAATPSSIAQAKYAHVSIAHGSVWSARHRRRPVRSSLPSDSAIMQPMWRGATAVDRSFVAPMDFGGSVRGVTSLGWPVPRARPNARAGASSAPPAYRAMPKIPYSVAKVQRCCAVSAARSISSTAGRSPTVPPASSSVRVAATASAVRPPIAARVATSRAAIRRPYWFVMGERPNGWTACGWALRAAIPIEIGACRRRLRTGRGYCVGGSTSIA